MPGVPILAIQAFRGFLRASGVSHRSGGEVSRKTTVVYSPAGISCKQSRRDEQKRAWPEFTNVRCVACQRGLGGGAILRNLSRQHPECSFSLPRQTREM